MIFLNLQSRTTPQNVAQSFRIGGKLVKTKQDYKMPLCDRIAQQNPLSMALLSGNWKCAIMHFHPHLQFLLQSHNPLGWLKIQSHFQGTTLSKTKLKCKQSCIEFCCLPRLMLVDNRPLLDDDVAAVRVSICAWWRAHVPQCCLHWALSFIPYSLFLRSQVETTLISFGFMMARF